MTSSIFLFCITKLPHHLVSNISFFKPIIFTVNKQLNDKERVAAALENTKLLGLVNKCIDNTDPERSILTTDEKARLEAWIERFLSA